MEEYFRTLSILFLLELLCSYLGFNNGLRDSILLQLDVANSNLVSLIWNLKPFFLKIKIGATKSGWRYYVINSLNYALFSYIKHLHVHC